MNRVRMLFTAAIVMLTLTMPAVAQNPVRGNSAIRGRVLDPAGQPIAGALVRRDGSTDTARAGTDGAFLLGQLALGRHSFTVSHAGYQEIAFEVEFSAIDTATVDIPLERGGAAGGSPYATLAPGAVAAKLDSVGFNSRRANPPSSAVFFTSDTITARAVTKLSQLLEGVRDVTLRLEAGNMMMAYGHDQRCQMNVWLDNSRLDNVFPPTSSSSRRSSSSIRYTGLDEILPLTAIAAIEVYALPSQIPQRFQTQGTTASAYERRGRSMSGASAMSGNSANCGAIILWSR